VVRQGAATSWGIRPPGSPVISANEGRAQNGDDYLDAHCDDEKSAALADKYRNSRPEMHLQGLTPKQFAAIKVARRRPKER
jgi:hypothetical protein